MDLAERLREELTSDVEQAGLYLEAVEVKGNAGQRLIRVVIDLPTGPGGVDSDQIDALTRQISPRFDEFEFLGNAPFTLEVSTPGLSRPLTTPRHFSRAIDRYIAVSLASGELIGTVSAADESTLTLIDDAGKSHIINQADIVRARYEIKW